MRSFRAEKIGNGIKRPKSKNMVGLKSKTIQLKNQLSTLHSNQKHSLRELKLDIKKIENSIISLRGLDNLSTLEIEKIQDRRKSIAFHMVELVSNLVASSRKISDLENRYQSR